MKKLLAVLLVLGMASMASAALIPTGIDAGVLRAGDVVGLSTDENVSGYDVSILTTGDVTLDISGIMFPEEFFLPGTVVTADPLRLSGSEIFATAHGAGNMLVDGIVIGGTAGTIELIDELGGGISLGVIDVIPEPMTLSLLGLGGLALIRRR